MKGFKIFIIAVFLIGTLQIVQAQTNETDRMLKISDNDKMILVFFEEEKLIFALTSMRDILN